GRARAPGGRGGGAPRRSLLRRLGLTGAAPRQWRVREQAERDEPVACRSVPPGQVVADDPEVVLRHVRELGTAGTFADRPDAWHTRLQTFVDLDEAPRIEPDADGLQSDARGVGSASGGNKDVAALNVPLALRCPHAQAHAFSGPPLNLKNLGR